MTGAVAAPRSALETRSFIGDLSKPLAQEYALLYAGFIVAPIVAGADKFFNGLASWERYLAPQVASLLPVSARAFMVVVGAIEIAAGVLVAWKPRIGGLVVGAWLLGIVGNLVLAGLFDVALRDFGLALGAFALARLAAARESAGGE